MRWGSLFVPVHLAPLVPLFIAATYTFVVSCPPFLSSSFCPCCAHTCTFAFTLVLRLPSGRRVCVYPLESLSQGSCWSGILQQGAQAAYPVSHQRKHWICAGDIDPGRRINVPALRETYVIDKLLHFCVLQ